MARPAWRPGGPLRAAEPPGGRWHAAAQVPSDDAVLAAVIDLSGGAAPPPSMSQIASRLADSGAVTGPFQSGVREALEQLRARGHVERFTLHGTHRWRAAQAERRWPR